MESEKFEPEKTVVRKPSGWGQRHVLALMGFWSFAMNYAMRFNLSLAIVAMVNRTRAIQNGSDVEAFGNFTKVVVDACPHLKAAKDEAAALSPQNLISSQGEFNWNGAEQGIILGAFFWGYIAMHLPGGILAHRFGGKWPLGIGMLVTGVFTLLTPWAARTHKSLLIFVRVVQGLGEGIAFPAMHTMISAWAPPDERSKIGSIIYAGAQFGTAATLVTGGYLIDGEVMGGWPSLFYVPGLITVIWFVFWSFLVFDKPCDHPRIDIGELTYIENVLGGQASKVKVPTPWKSILTSMPVYAIMIVGFGHAWGLYTLLTQMPTYLNTVLHFDIKKNSWISAMPHIIMWIVSISLSQVADFIISRKILSTVAIRKIFSAVAHLGSALALIGTAFSGCNSSTTVAFLTLAVGIEGAAYGGFIVNHVDLSPNHAGVLFGLCNTFSNISGFLTPYIAGVLVGKNPSLENWQYVFFIAAAIYVADAIFYAIYAEATVQPWNGGSSSYQEKLKKQENPLMGEKEKPENE